MARSVSKLVNRVLNCDVLVVGGGSAGLFAAIKAKELGKKVILVDKAYVGRSGCSPFAAGAITALFPEQDDFDTWFEEIVSRGEYLNDQEWVKIFLEEGYRYVNELQEWGKSLSKLVIREDNQGKYIRMRSRGHTNVRSCVMDALSMMDTLRGKALKAGVELVERVMVTDLVVDEGRAVGTLGLHTRTAETYLFTAKAVILAAGGCSFKAFYIGQRNITGEAQYMAFKAGAWLRNLDQAMSNSTARDLDIHGAGAMMGFGGRFVNNLGEEFMWRYDPELGNLGRMTRVVIGMAKEIEAGRGPVYVDLTKVSPENQATLRELLPEGFRAFHRMGIDPFKQNIEWMPAFEGTLVHGGGIHINAECQSTLPGLYAIGDASCTPEHGTYSLGGLNLTFCLISGARAADSAAKCADELAPIQPDKAAEQVELDVREILAPVKRADGIRSDELNYRLLETLIPYKVAYLRNESTLTEALERLQKLRSEELPRVYARDPHELVKANEIKSMIWVGDMVLQSVLFRRESRGFVWREDFPYTDNKNWLKWIMVGKGDHGIRVWAQDFPTPYLKPPLEIYSPF